MNTYTVFWAYDWAPLQTVLSLPPDRLPTTPEGWIGLALAHRDPDLAPEDAAAQMDAGGWVLVAVCDGIPTGPVIEEAAP